MNIDAKILNKKSYQIKSNNIKRHHIKSLTPGMQVDSTFEQSINVLTNNKEKPYNYFNRGGGESI